MDYKKLQNGSDIRGVALEGIEGQHVNLTEQAVKDIGRGFALWLVQKTGKTDLRVAVGRDSRLSGETLCGWICQAMVESGLNVTDFGMASTPAMFMATVTEGYAFDGSVMITASHLPFNRNGFKFFTADGGLESADIKQILGYAGGGEMTGLKPGCLVSGSFMDTYAGILADKIRRATGEEMPLAGFRIVVDAGNGAGGFYVDKVLKPLGADTEGSRYLDPDGSFPNHIPNPEDKTAMESITEAVNQTGADLGIIFDTDVDRAGAVLSDGSELNRNRIIAMLAAILLREHPGTTIVTDSITSTGLARFIAEKGGVHHRFKRGYRNVINESIRLNRAGQDSQLAIETSGHGALKENYFLDDGAYLVTKLLIELARGKREGYTLESLIETLEEPAESVEFRMNILLEEFKPYGQRVIDELTAYAGHQPGWSLAPGNFEGVRVNLDEDHGNGWFLLRLSLHDPLLPLNIESSSVGGAKKIAKELAGFIAGYDKLDAGKLLDFIEQEVVSVKWHGFRQEKLDFEGHEGIVVFPEKANGRLAVKTEYWDAFPEAVETDLVKAGFHLCYLRNDNRWGTDADLDRKARFVAYVAEKYGLAEKTVPVGMSCGGLIAIKFAAKYPEQVSCLYLDAPVLNYMSCPCGFGVGEALGGGSGIPEILKALGMESISQLLSYREMPLDRVPELVKARIPVVMVAGGKDRTVPYCENGAYLQSAYEKTDLDFRLFIKPECDHHPHGLEDNREVIRFILEH